MSYVKPTAMETLLANLREECISIEHGDDICGARIDFNESRAETLIEIFMDRRGDELAHRVKELEARLKTLEGIVNP